MPIADLLEEVRWVICLKHLSLHTECCYLDYIRRLTWFHYRRHPRHMGAAKLRTFSPTWVSREDCSFHPERRLQCFGFMLLLTSHAGQ
jgi:hypothetical protein